VIYSIFNTEFREAFRRILVAHAGPLCCCCCSQYEAVSGQHPGGGGHRFEGARGPPSGGNDNGAATSTFEPVPLRSSGGAVVRFHSGEFDASDAKAADI
jgi:hypothetical protein